MKKEEVDLFVHKVGERIFELRKAQNMTQLDLAIKSDMDESQVQRLETARSAPTLKTLYKILKGLGIEFRHFFDSDKLNHF